MYAKICGTHKMEAVKPAQRGKFARPSQTATEVSEEVLAVIKAYIDRFDKREVENIFARWEAFRLDGWALLECCHKKRHAGGSLKPFRLFLTRDNKREDKRKYAGSFKCHSTRCKQRGGRGGYHLIGHILDLNFALSADRRIAASKMVELGLWTNDGRKLTPEELAERDRKEMRERQMYAARRRREAAEIAHLRAELAAPGLVEPPFGIYERDATLEEITYWIEEKGYWVFPCDPISKLPAQTLQADKHYRYLWKDNATQDISLVKRWLDNGCRIGIYCGKSGIAVFDIDYKNFALSTRHDDAAKEYYTGWSRAKLEDTHKWQCAIASRMMQACNNNIAPTPGGGFHCFFADPMRQFSNTPLTDVEGSVFEFGVGFCEIKAGAGYVLFYHRHGDGHLQPLPKMIADHANLA